MHALHLHRDVPRKAAKNGQFTGRSTARKSFTQSDGAERHRNKLMNTSGSRNLQVYKATLSGRCEIHNINNHFPKPKTPQYFNSTIFCSSKMKIIQALVLLGAYVASTSATVFTGTLNGQNIAYFNGDDQCADNTALHPNICDVSVSLD